MIAPYKNFEKILSYLRAAPNSNLLEGFIRWTDNLWSKRFVEKTSCFGQTSKCRHFCELDILETYFICDHNSSQSPYSVKRKKHTKAYKKGENLEDVIMLRSNVTLSDWITQKEFENKQPNDVWFKRFRNLILISHPIKIPLLKFLKVRQL